MAKRCKDQEPSTDFQSQFFSPALSKIDFDSHIINFLQLLLLGHIVNLYLLLCTWLNLKHADLFWYLSFTQRPINDWKIEPMIERLNQAISAALSITYYSQIHEFNFNMKKKLSLPKKLKCIKPFWSSHRVSIIRMAAPLPAAGQLLPEAIAADSEAPCNYACQSDQPKLCQSAAPRGWPLIFHSKSSIAFWNSREWLPDDQQQGLKLGLKLELSLLTNKLLWVYLPRIKCGAWILFRSVQQFKDAKIQASKITISIFITQAAQTYKKCETQKIWNRESLCSLKSQRHQAANLVVYLNASENWT